MRSNVDYIVVASFVLQYEDANSIAEALRIIQSWNVDWLPCSFMVDFSEAEINSLENVFPSTFFCNIQLVLLKHSWVSVFLYGFVPTIRHNGGGLSNDENFCQGGGGGWQL